MSALVKPVFATFNAAQPTTAAIVAVTTGTAVKTMLQIKAPAAAGMVIEGWGFSWDSAVGASSVVELLTTDVAATVTAHVASGVLSYGKAAAVSTVQLGTSATGYTASAEGTVAAAKVFDAVMIGTTTAVEPFSRTFADRERPYLPAGSFLRVRATVGTTATNLLCWVRWHEGE
jgi:hypothetical protein